ncbi:hypothetical protein, partial [Haliangium sp.]|uniref:hypothetical protein n=1 Tax=Haliangium sp. TaxID=2663208 RepID=UPI003D1283CE
MEPFELFLSPAEDGGQTLPGGLGLHTLRETGAVPDDDEDDSSRKSHIDPGGEPDSLHDQGWAVVVPRGEDGDRLLALTAPLLRKRAQEQGLEKVGIYRVPSTLSTSQAVQWLDRVLVGNRTLAEIPGYVCILGGPTQVSFELQQVLSTGFCAGRIAFDQDEHYEAYVDKLLRWEQAPRDASGRAIFFTARDGTSATEIGHRRFMQPTIEDVRNDGARGRYALDDILDLAGDDPVATADELLAAAAREQPSFLMTCSHGMGAPRSGWDSPERRRALQGALCLGEGRHIAADDLARAHFLPGGLWFFFACYGLGTPARSAYHAWLRRLHAMGELGSDPDVVLRSLPQDGEPPFLAALPKAALANPNGPLAVVGHLDLAWTYSFQDVEKMTGSERHRRYQGLLDLALRGKPMGLAFGDLRRARNLVKTDLTVASDRVVQAQEAGEEAPDESIRMGHRWMLHHDLDGYLLLGDPAARLPVRPPGR